MAYGIWYNNVLSTIRSLPGARLGPDHRQVQASFIYPLSASGNPASLFWAWDVRLPPQAPHQPITKSMTRSTTKTGSNTSIRITTATTTTNNNSSTNSNKSCNINCCNTSSNNSNSNSIFLTWRVYQMKPFSSLKCRDGHPRYLEELVLFRKTMVPMDEGSSFHSDLSIML